MKKWNIDHSRSGDLIAIANKDSWFTYYYWKNDDKAPDFARTVEIHKKPGYDPVELFFDPKIKMIYPKLIFKLLKKKLGFRTLMNVIPLDASLVKGSHGRLNENENDRPIIISNNSSGIKYANIDSTEVFNIILSQVISSEEKINDRLKDITNKNLLKK